jgi:nicotinamide mononucleotide transporter
VYFVLGVIGWYWWLRGGENRSQLKVTRASLREIIAVSAFVAVATVGLWRVLHPLRGAASFWDSLTASISLAAQWLLNRKRLESWVGWILVDAIYVPLYLYKELYLTAILYAVFLAMAVMGLRAWRQSWRARPAALGVAPLVGGAYS